MTVVGAARGLRTTAEAVADGAAAGGDTGLTGNAVILPPADDLAATVGEPAALYLVADDDVDPSTLTEHFVDVQRDVTVADLVRATGAGLASVEHVKRYTTAGTAHDQGKTSGLLSTAVIAHVLGVEPGELGTTTYRPPYTPISFAALAGRERGDLYDPVRTTGAHSWHVAHGAEFENVGQWKRPWFYPEPGEDMETAVLARMRSRQNQCRVHGRFDAGQDRRAGSGRCCLSGHDLHEPDVQPEGRDDPVRGDVHARWDGLR